MSHCSSNCICMMCCNFFLNSFIINKILKGKKRHCILKERKEKIKETNILSLEKYRYVSLLIYAIVYALFKKVTIIRFG